jgi:hypothetical protein
MAFDKQRRICSKDRTHWGEWLEIHCDVNGYCGRALCCAGIRGPQIFIAKYLHRQI